MSLTHRSRTGTAFASATREPFPVIRAQRAAFFAEPLAVSMLDAMPGPAFVLNPRRQIVAFNGLLAETLGLTEPEELLGLRPGEAVRCTHASERVTGCGTTPSCAECGAVNAVLDCLRTKQRVVRECRIVTETPRGTGALDFRVHATFVTFGPNDYVVVGLEDIGDEKRREVLERTFFQDLLGSCRDVHAIAGELRGDLPAAGVPADRARDLEEISGHVLEQVEAQRTLLAAERGELEVDAQDIDLRQVLNGVVQLVRREPLAAGRTIRFEAARHCTICTDRVLVGRAIGALLRNALEATRDGGTVEVTCEYDHELATITVHNEGVIPDEIQRQVFQRSFSTHDEPGRGTGTYAARLLVEDYLQGRLAFTSEPRVGTLFVIVLPRRLQRAATG